MNRLERVKDWIIPIQTVELCILKLDREKEKISENMIICKRHESGKFLCETDDGEDIWMEEKPSCQDIKDYETKKGDILLSCEIKESRDYSRVSKAAKIVAAIAINSIPSLTPLKTIM